MGEQEHSARRLVPVALFVAVCSISFASIFFRKAAPTHPLVCAGLRLAVAAVLLAPLTVRAALNGRLAGRQLFYALGAGLAYGVHFGAWVTSLTLTTVAASVTLVTTTPLILAFAGVITRKDRPDRRLGFSIGLAFFGLLIIGSKDLHQGAGALTGDALALLGAAAMASYMLIGRKLGDELDLWAFTGVATAVGAVALLTTALILGIPLQPASTESFVFIALAALLPQLVGHSLLTWSLRHARPATVSMAVVGHAVGATLLAWIWLSEIITARIALGCVLTLAAVALAIAARPLMKLDEDR